MKIKTLLIILITLAIAAGCFFAVRWQVRRYKEVNDALTRALAGSLRALDFIETEFPDQTKAYLEKLKAKQEATQ